MQRGHRGISHEVISERHDDDPPSLSDLDAHAEELQVRDHLHQRTEVARLLRCLKIFEEVHVESPFFTASSEINVPRVASAKVAAALANGFSGSSTYAIARTNATVEEWW